MTTRATTTIVKSIEQELVWRSPTSWTPLQDDHVHIWLSNLDLEVFELPKFLRDLSLAERTRAQHLRFEHDRRRFVAAKGILRQLLAEYLRIEARDVQFSVNASGKPELAPRLQAQHGTIYFNQAHSAHMGIFAFCKNRRVGVDLEEIRPFPDIDQIADLLFSTHELTSFRALSEEERYPCFFKAWTHKEAFVKAIGQGLTLPLNHFEISSTGPHTSQIVQNHAHPSRPLDWYVKDLSAPAQFSAAVCVEGDGWKLRCCKR